MLLATFTFAVKPKNINLPSIPYNPPTVNTSMYPPTSTENNQNLREYRCTRCGQPKKGHVCTADPDAPETWTQWKPTPVPKQQVYKVNYIQAVIQELEPPPSGESEIWTSRLYKDEEEGSWGGEFRVCHYEKEGGKKVGVRVEESWMEVRWTFEEPIFVFTNYSNSSSLRSPIAAVPVCEFVEERGERGEEEF